MPRRRRLAPGTPYPNRRRASRRRAVTEDVYGRTPTADVGVARRWTPRPERVFVLLGLLVAVGAFVRWLASLAHVVPYYVADEYIYAALARGIAEHGAPVVRGSQASFPALLEPLQTSPFYALADIDTAVRLTQALHAVEMSLAAVPVFFLGRRLGLRDGVSLACAAVAITSPALFWASFTVADALGYALALTAVYAAVRVLAAPKLSSQIAFVATAALATFARTQYVVLFGVLAAAAVVVERGNGRRALRNQWLTLALLGAGLVGLVGIGIVGVLGPYSAWIGVATDAVVVAKSVGLDALVVALAAGLFVVPGAIVGLDGMLTRPRDRNEHAFAAVVLFLGCALAGLASLGAFARVQERYLVCLTPLPALLFSLWVARGMPRRRVAAAIALALGAAYAAVALTGWEAAHSPTVHALSKLEDVAGSGVAARIAPVALLGILAALLWGRRQIGASALAAALAVTSGLSIGAYAFDRGHAQLVRDIRLPERKDWVDASGLRDVAVLNAPHAERAAAFQPLYWNTSVDRVLELPGSPELDFFSVAQSRIAPDGILLAQGSPVTTPILAPRQGTVFTFAGARVVRRTHDFELVRPAGRPLTVATAALGRYRDGWVEARASVRAWRPAVRGASVVEFALSLPAAAPAAVRVTLTAPGLRRKLVIEPGARLPVSVPLGPKPLRLLVESDRTMQIGERRVAVRMSRPQLG